MRSVPFYSQYDESVPAEWRDRACGIMCLKMAMETYSSSTFAVHDLITEALAVKAYQEGTGWNHQGLVYMAHNRGIPAYQEEFKSLDYLTNEPRTVMQDQLMRHGIRKFKSELSHGNIVLVSVGKDMQAGGSPHIVLLVGAERGGFLYHDPHKETPAQGANQLIQEENFVKAWRLLSIVVG